MEHPPEQKRILVVDDEAMVCFSVEMLLETEGHVVDKATSGAEALALFQPGKYDIVFTDYSMPEMRGDELAAALKKLSPKQPVVMLTGFPGALHSSDDHLAGVDSVICKPFELATLLWAIRRFAAA